MQFCIWNLLTSWHTVGIQLAHLVSRLTGNVKHKGEPIYDQIALVLILFNGLMFSSHQISQANRSQRKIQWFSWKDFKDSDTSL